MSKQEGFVQMYNKMVLSETLSVYEKSLFAVFLTYKGLDVIYVGYDKLMKQSGMSRSKLIKTIKTLSEKKYIKVIKSNAHNTNVYQLLSKGVVSEKNHVVSEKHPEVSEKDGGVSEKNGGGVCETRGGVSEKNPNNKDFKNKELIIKDNKEFVDSVFGYLNTKTKRTGSSAFRTNDKRSKLILARRDEILKDDRYKANPFQPFKHVMDVTYALWSDDDKMKVYISPDTLFRPSNFPKYLDWQYQDKGSPIKVANNSTDAFKRWLPTHMQVDGEWKNRDEQMAIYETLDADGKNNFKELAKQQKESRKNITQITQSIGR